MTETLEQAGYGVDAGLEGVDLGQQRIQLLRNALLLCEWSDHDWHRSQSFKIDALLCGAFCIVLKKTLRNWRLEEKSKVVGFEVLCFEHRDTSLDREFW
ncbi:hypothetical protein LA05_18560 [Xanthomonas oryzae pv. oryzae]|nr:hypothetical protein LA05_18560 [Xanthomonas oryzae pv. oryzae]